MDLDPKKPEGIENVTFNIKENGVAIVCIDR